MKLVQYPDDCHRKNRESMERMCKSVGIEFEATNDYERCKRPDVDILWFPMKWISPDEFPGKPILYGPHHYVFPEGPILGKENPEWAARCAYLTLSEWNRVIHREFAPESVIPFVAIPFGINPAIPDSKQTEKEIDCIVYFKGRRRDELELATRILEQRGLSYKLFAYGSYINSDYEASLRKAKFCVWIGRHESQGFAFQECMASNVPILCWDVMSMYEELNHDGTSVYESYRGRKQLNATCAPLWSDQCGIRITREDELESALDQMMATYSSFNPREVVYSHNSDAHVMKQMLSSVGVSLDRPVQRLVQAPGKRLRMIQYPDVCHQKNHESMARMCRLAGIDFEVTTDLEHCAQADILWFPHSWVSPDKFSGKPILYGPTHFIFPEGPIVGQPNPEWASRCVYTTLAPWNQALHQRVAPSSVIPFSPLPFGIDSRIENCEGHTKLLDCVVYSKRRHHSGIDQILDALERRGLTYKVFTYGSYKPKEYAESFRVAKFCIWIGCHESQGFAFQECMARNIPILCWDATSMFDEVYPSGASMYEYLNGHRDLSATSANVWSDECGIKITHHYEFEPALDRMLQRYTEFNPRSVIYRHNSDAMCARRMFRAVGLDVYVRPETISVCIPCYKRHIPNLLTCLKSIDAQTIQPDEIVVSCSDTTAKEIADVFGSYQPKAPFILILHAGRKNASQNRNIAASCAKSYYVSFFDADDVMHPQRIETILGGIERHPDTDILLHNFTSSPDAFRPVDVPAYVPNVLHRGPTGCPILTGVHGTPHCSQSTTKRSVWNSVKFKEDVAHERKEDAIFCGDVVNIPGIKSLYCPNELSAYVPEGRWYEQSTTTAFVTLCDSGYLPKAQTTIKDLRTRGGWTGPIILVLVDCDAPPDFLQEYNVTPYRTTHINTKQLVYQLKSFPLDPTHDNRHFGKLTQWDKLQVFRTWFKQWNRIVFLDAGLRVVQSVDPLLEVEWQGSFVAPDDAGIAPERDNKHRLRTQIQLGVNPDAERILHTEFPTLDLSSRYFLNCMFVFDTKLITPSLYEDLECLMNAIPIMRCNEMGLMNLWFNVRERVWKPFPEMVGDKYLFGWSEPTIPGCPHWSRFHFLKYPCGRID